jgi:hypothetical protein
VQPLALVVAVSKNLKGAVLLQRQLSAISTRQQSEHVLPKELPKSVAQLE